MKTRRYSELITLATFEERFQYLRLTGSVGKSTFGVDRHFNQAFYTSTEWRRVRREAIVRDRGCDLGISEFEIGGPIFVHHMNPVTLDDLELNIAHVLDLEFLICACATTHQAIHYGDDSNILRLPEARRPGDTIPWR